MTLDNGIHCQLRPLQQVDEELIKALYLAVPEEERAFIKQRITDGSIFHEWCENIDYEENLPMLVLNNGRVMAEGTLHQRQGGWKSHIGLVSVLTHPEFRGVGLSKILIEHLTTIARHCGLTKLEAEFNGEREIAIAEFAKIGFNELFRESNYVRDLHQNYHDYVLMGMNLKTDEEYAGAQ
ncbi:MAG: GNAT family N-acetyltransferase [Limisphaerales bacterium]